MAAILTYKQVVPSAAFDNNCHQLLPVHSKQQTESKKVDNVFNDQHKI